MSQQPHPLLPQMREYAGGFARIYTTVGTFEGVIYLKEVGPNPVTLEHVELHDFRQIGFPKKKAMRILVLDPATIMAIEP